VSAVLFDPTDYENFMKFLRDPHHKSDKDRRPNRGRVEKRRGRDRHNRIPFSERVFYGIDGEGGGTNEFGQQNYLLLCASDREGSDTRTLFRDNAPLSTKECLDFILELPREALIMGFFFDYDITHILRDLPEHIIIRLLRNRENYDDGGLKTAPGVKVWTHWEGYALMFMPRKHLCVAQSSEQRSKKTGMLGPEVDKKTTRIVHEGGGFFQCSFVKALDNWSIGTAEQRQFIAETKKLRPDFERMTDVEIGYCKLECSLLAEMMHQYRETAFDCERKILERTGLPIKVMPTTPEGAGASASVMHESAGTPRRALKKLKVGEDRSKYLPELAAELMKTAKDGYYGGRFEVSRTGLIKGPVYEADINSAYPTAMLSLSKSLSRWPAAHCLAKGVKEAA
jgi:hypothetical protein